MTRRACGFSLIEMAFVLIIVTLILGGLLVPFATQVEQKRIGETQKAMEEIKEALLGFALANRRLPCPDLVAGANANDGVEDPLGGPCAATEGNLPWATLGVSNSDAWGNRFRYRVTGTFTVAGGIALNPPTTGDIDVTDANDVPALVLSHGKNGFGAINSASNTQNPLPGATRPDEAENTDGDANFVSRTITGAGAGASEFDDLVIWLSPNVLFNRMVAAGQLP